MVGNVQTSALLDATRVICWGHGTDRCFNQPDRLLHLLTIEGLHILRNKPRTWPGHAIWEWRHVQVSMSI